MNDLYLRDYHKIFTGPPQKGGYQNIFLSYDAKTTEIVLEADKTTYFHMPFFSQKINIAHSGLIEAGAVGGLTPFNSDKIYKKQANYEKYSTWGNALGKRDGEWVCSWLYLSATNSKPVWMDRFYKPGIVTYNEAINTQYSQTKFTESVPAIFDLPSKLTLDPGVWYSYYHIGDKKIANTIKNIGGQTGKYLTFSTILSNNELINGTDYPVQLTKNQNLSYLSNLAPFPQQKSLDYTTKYLNTYVQYTSELRFDKNEVGLNFWILHNDWNQCINTTLIGNLEKNNFEVKFENNTSFIYYVVGLKEQKKIAFFSQENKNYQNIFLDYTPQLIVQDANNNTFVTGDFDDINSIIQKYDYNGALLSETRLRTQINDVSLYSDGRLEIMADDRITTYSNNLVLLQNVFGDFINRSLFIDKNDQRHIIDFSSQCIVADNDNNIYLSRGRTIQKNFRRTGISVEKTIHKILIHERELWILSGNNTMHVFNLDTERLIRRFNVSNSEIQDRFAGIVVVSDYTEFSPKEYILLETYNGRNRYRQRVFVKNQTTGAREILHLWVEWNTNRTRWEYVMRNSEDEFIQVLNYTINGNVEYPWQGVWFDSNQIAVNKYRTDRVTTRATETNFDFIKKYNRLTKKIETTLLFVSNIENCLYELFLDGTHKKDVTLQGLFYLNNFNYDSSFVIRKDITGYKQKQFVYGNNQYITFFVKVFDNEFKSQIIQVPVNVNSLLINCWYMVTCTFSKNTLNVYINGNLLGTYKIPNYLTTQMLFKNNLYIGQPPSKTASINDEILSNSLQFNGFLSNIKIYSYELQPEDIVFLLKEGIKQDNLYWNVPVNRQHYIEEIERFFKHRVPGSKSNFYNIKILGGSVYSEQIKLQIETEIKKIINKVMPGHTQLYKIIWQ